MGRVPRVGMWGERAFQAEETVKYSQVAGNIV